MAPSPAHHKPRRRQNENEKKDILLQPSAGSISASVQTRPKSPSFPLEAFLWPARGGASQWTVISLILMVAGLFRWTAGFWGYSGFQSPPMHGDFEAQRHWMEITTKLPVSQWYFHDLEWWGLDYPPLTAYHSWVLGKIGDVLDNSWFALHSSRRNDNPSLKVYMRATVIVSEYAIYVPAIILFCRHVARSNRVNDWTFAVALTAVLMQPATILIDHAHFQYNTVMLGFVVACMTALVRRSFLWSCVFFVAALGFKQMALYYAPAIFAYLLGSCVFPRLDIGRLLAISTVTAISFALLFAPLLLGALYDAQTSKTLTEGPLPEPPLLQSLNLDPKTFYYPLILQLGQTIHRVFPFARGLFEDKVANFWCFAHTFHKLHVYPPALLQRVSLAATLAAITPPCLLIFQYPQPNVLLPALAATSWGFFLFSFQVHEKSVLLPLLPMTLMLVTENGLKPATRSWIAWANILGCWTMYPLLKRDQLRVPYFVLTSLWAWLMGLPAVTGDILRDERESWFNKLSAGFHVLLGLVMAGWQVMEYSVVPPASKPDFWVVVNVLVGAPAFGVCYLWCLWKAWEAVPGAARGGRGEKPKSN